MLCYICSLLVDNDNCWQRAGVEHRGSTAWVAVALAGHWSRYCCRSVLHSYEVASVLYHICIYRMILVWRLIDASKSCQRPKRYGRRCRCSLVNGNVDGCRGGEPWTTGEKWEIASEN